MFASLSPARRRLALIVTSGALAAGLVGAGFAIAANSDRSSAEAVDQAQPGPVLLVPGYGGSTTGLQTLAGRLRDGGRDVTVVGLPNGGEGDLNQQAEVLAGQVKATLARTGAPSVDIVGYSAGGVVARIWARDDGGAALARRVVTLGSPQHGTQLASLGALVPGECPIACQQLTPSSDLLARLNQGNETPAGPEFVSIWTSHDDVVIPPDSAVLAGARNIEVQSVCAGSTVNHSGLPMDRLVDNMTMAELGVGPTVALSTADCARLSS